MKIRKSASSSGSPKQERHPIMERFANKSYYRDEAAKSEIQYIDHRYRDSDGRIRLPLASHRKHCAQAVDSNRRKACFFLHDRVPEKSGHRNCAHRHRFEERCAFGGLKTVNVGRNKSARDPQSRLAKTERDLCAGSGGSRPVAVSSHNGRSSFRAVDYRSCNSTGGVEVVECCGG